jgi:MFS family permease
VKTFLCPKFLPFYVLGAGLIGYLLRLWTLGSGPNHLGLYEPQTFAWVLLWIVSLLCLGLILLLIRPLKKPGEYHDHFFASLPAAVGNGFAAVGFLLTGFRASGNPSTVFSLLMSLLAIGAALGMCLCAIARYRGNRQPFWPYLLACLMLGLRLFDRCRGWGEAPQTGTFIFPFLASACLMLALFQMTAYQVNLGRRRSCLFYTLISIYLSMVSLALSGETLFYLCMIVFLVTNLCNLAPLNRPRVKPTHTPKEPKQPTDPSQMSYDDLLDWLKNG